MNTVDYTVIIINRPVVDIQLALYTQADLD